MTLPRPPSENLMLLTVGLEAPHHYSNTSASSKRRSGITVPPPVNGSGNGRNQPQKRAGKINPHGVLHALDVAVALGILVYEQLRPRC